MNKSKQQLSKPKQQNTGNRMVSAPAAKAMVDKIHKPRFSMPSRTNDGRVTIRHREYIADINGSVLFTSVGYALNPGLAISFPWLNTIAIAYESYKFKSLKFSFESSKSTSTNGSILMAVDFDSTDPAPTTKAQALSYNNAIRGPAWETFQYVCSSGDLSKLNQKFLRYGNLVAGQDILLFDVGNLFVCTAGFADSSNIGELHVDYEVEMFTPQFDLQAYALATSAKVVAVGPITSTNWLGTSIVLTGGVHCVYTTPILSILIPGQYLLTYSVDGTGLVQAGSPVIVSIGNTNSLLSSTISATRITYVVAIQLDNPGAGIGLTSIFTASTTVTGAVLRISYYGVSLA